MSAVPHAAAPAGPLDASASPHAALRPLGFRDAAITGGFWAGRQRLNREVLIPGGLDRLESAGNLHDLRAAAGREDGPFEGLVFMDSDVHKWLEAVGWEIGREPSEALARPADELIALLADAQEDDGYLDSYYQVARPGERFANLAWDHELYCCGHLVQAAVAHARGRGDDALLRVATRFADHVAGVFGPGRRPGTPGHPEIETALVELSRLTGEPRYRELAGFFVDQRGHGTLQPATFGPSYFPDHQPVREQTEITGHAVRALYLAAGVADLYLETGEDRLLEVMRAQWEDMARRKMYLTGAVGAHHMDEAFGDAYELPPDRCYGETCAAIASVHFNWRMLVATGEGRYADLLERTLYNAFLAGLALDGSGYSYVNPLHVRDAHHDAVERGARRQPWYTCACCPPNVMRLLASLQHYLATSTDAGIQVHQYATGTVRAHGVELRVSTGYPWREQVEIEVAASGSEPWELALRIPAWCHGARAEVAGESHDAAPGEPLRLTRRWRAGDRVRLTLPLTPRLTAPHPHVDAVRGCLAIERGPLVFCLEGADAPAGAGVDDLRIVADAPLRDVPRDDLLGGIVAVAAQGRRVRAPRELYAERTRAPTPEREPVELLAVPYALWGNRREGGMRVWIPVAEPEPEPEPEP